jgi:uncharacterized protein YbbK (DUF523 family)
MGEVTSEHPLIAISSCLLGEKVRYDGRDKLDRFLRDTFGQIVKYLPCVRRPNAGSECREKRCGSRETRGVGCFARAIMEHFRLLPAEKIAAFTTRSCGTSF